MDEAPPKAGHPLEVFDAVLHLGLTGSSTSAVRLRAEFVERRAWVDEAEFEGLVRLTRLIPGLGGAQLAMALGGRRAGLAGALAAAAAVLIPPTAAMVAFAWLAPRLIDRFGDGWLHGMAVAAAAILLHALVGLARPLAAGPVRSGMAIGAAAGLVIAHGPLPHLFVLAAGAAFGALLLRDAPPSEPIAGVAAAARRAWAALALLGVLLAGLPFLADALASPLLALASVFLRAGAAVVGSDLLSLPLLNAELVGQSWAREDVLIAGFAAAQALPAGMVGFAAFAGASAGGWLGGVAAAAAFLVAGLLWLQAAQGFAPALHENPRLRGALSGAGAVALGALGAALWDPILTLAIHRTGDWALAAAAYVFLSVARLPAWLVVAGFALATGVLGR